MKRALLCLIACLLPALAQASERPWQAMVTHVVDGDTLWVRTEGRDGQRLKLRIADIDAPELCQPHGEAAREALRAMVEGRRVQLSTRAVDDYGRLLVRLHLQQLDVGASLVSGGHAWSPGFRGRPGRYRAQQQAARAARKGLFAQEAPLAPDRFRRQHGPCDHAVVKAAR